MSVDTIYRIQLRRGISTDWEIVNPILGDGEPGFERDTGMIKVGDGATHWLDLPYLSAEGADVVTPPVDDSDTSIATTEWFMNQASDALPLALSTPAAAGSSKRWSRADHRHLDQYVNSTGDMMTGTLRVENDQYVASEVYITSPEEDAFLSLKSRSGKASEVHLGLSTIDRWVISKNAQPETGNDVGSDFTITRYNDQGVFQGVVLGMYRSTGRVIVYPTKAGGVVNVLNDTGWRSVPPIFGWTVSGLHIRRVGNQVFLRVLILNASASTGTSFYMCSAGFVADPGIVDMLASASPAGSLVRQVVSSTTTYVSIPQRVTSDPQFSGTLTWFTSDAWPTTLPGTPYP